MVKEFETLNWQHNGPFLDYRNFSRNTAAKPLRIFLQGIRYFAISNIAGLDRLMIIDSRYSGYLSEGNTPNSLIFPANTIWTLKIQHDRILHIHLQFELNTQIFRKPIQFYRHYVSYYDYRLIRPSRCQAHTSVGNV